MKKPVTLSQAIAYFADAERAFDYAKWLRWPDGKVACPRCGSESNSFVKTRSLWFCNGCKKQFTVKVGTIFEDSPMGLDKWMTAVWMICNCKNGISSYELGKAIGVRQNSAWFMLHRIREAMKDEDGFQFGGPTSEVESDETFVGGRGKFMHKDKKERLRKIEGKGNRGDIYMGKTAVHGMLDRELRKVRCSVIPYVRRDVLQSAILKNVERGSKVYTDENPSYDVLTKDFMHEIVHHAERYVNGRVHTNGLENFWCLLKRSLKGTYVAVEPFHLDHYLDEQVFRYNNRATKDNPLTDSDRFAYLMAKVAGKRLTYATLTGKDADALHHETAGTGQEEPF